MKILITGGAGFIGSHAALRLLQEGKQVVLVDNFHPYYSKQRKQQQLERVLHHEQLSFYECDILDQEKLQRIMKQERVDTVIHLAGLPGVQLSLTEPSSYIDININGTGSVLSCAGQAGIQHVVFGSSSSVYGDQHGIPLQEHMANGKVLSPYAASKFGAESFCYAYQYMYGFQLNILRFFTVYGPWGRPDMAIGSFVHKLLNGEEITVYGTGTGRDYTYIDDIVEGIWRVLQSKRSDVYNLGSNSPITMQDLLQELHGYFPNIRITHEGTRKGDVQSTWADITKANEQLGYEPKISFQEGLKRTVMWANEYAHRF